MTSLDATFMELRRILLDAGAGQIVASDEPGNVVLHTRRADPKTGKPEWFGAVTLKKNYVAYHLIPLYNDPALGALLSDGLAKRRQGKSCFNFKSIDQALFAELAALTRRGNRASGASSGSPQTTSSRKRNQ